MEDNKGEAQIGLENSKPYLSFNHYNAHFQLFAESPGRYFIKEYDLELIIHKNEQHLISGFTLHGDIDINCTKIE
jgi:hypothetical protein